MPVEESAVDPSSASDGGSADRLTVGRCLVEDRDDALASAHRVVTAAVEHRPGARGVLRASGFRGSHALASVVGVVVRVGMPSGTLWAAR